MTRLIVTSVLILATAMTVAAQNPAGETATPTRPRFATLTPVYFAYNSSAISDSARVSLVSAAEILKANAAAEITVVGHTDQRGPDEYNLRLGQRRARAIIEFLAAQGVSAGRLQAISAGEREPADSGQNEAAWARNRRAEFRVKGNAPLRLPAR